MGSSVSEEIINNFKVIKMYYNAGPDGLKCIRAKNIEILNNRAIFSSDEFLKMQANTSVIIQFYTDDGIYTTGAMFVKHVVAENDYKYITTYPVQGSHSQRRLYYRTDYQSDVQITINTIYDDSAVYNRPIHNLSAGGFSFLSPTNRFPSYNSMNVKFKMKDISMHLDAKLVHISKISSSKEYPYLLGFSFIKMNKEDADIISQQCFLYQIEQRKNKML